MPKSKFRKALVLNESFCVFCNNTNVNLLEENIVYSTSKICGHQICQVCFDTDALEKQETPCPVSSCDKVWKKTQLSYKGQEYLQYERHKLVRQEIKRDFNLRRQDFMSTPEYFSFQELTEQIINNLLLRQNLQWTEEQITLHRSQYRDRIAKNVTRLAEENRRFKEKISAQERKDIGMKQEIESAEVKALKRRLLHEHEQNLLKLGEINETTLSKQKREDLTNKRKEQLKSYQGALKPNEKRTGSMISKFWIHAQALQPTKQRTQQSAPDKITREERELAGGYSKDIVRAKRELLLQF